MADWQQSNQGQPPQLVVPCPECRQELVVRVNRRTQERFVACNAYPRCVHTQPLSEYLVKVVRGDPRLPGF